MMMSASLPTGKTLRHGPFCRHPRSHMAHAAPSRLPDQPLASTFAQQMLSLEAVLPTMSCSQLAMTATSIRETYRAALLSTKAAAGTSSPADMMTHELLDYFTSQLPNQSWLLTYRSAVQSHLQPVQEQQEQQHAGMVFEQVPQGSAVQAHGGVAPAASTATSRSRAANRPSDSGSGSSSSSGSSSTPSMCCNGQHCEPEHLAQILSAIATLPIQVVQPLPIGFGTPRWSRPIAAADPAAWEQWLALVTNAYADLLAQQLLQQAQQPGTQAQQEQQQQPWQQDAEEGGCGASPAADQDAWQHAHPADEQPLLQQLADFMISLACGMRWVNVNVDDDRLQTPEFRERVLQCLQQQQEPQQPQERIHAEGLGQQPAAGTQQQPQQEASTDAMQQQQHVPFALAGSLAHRLTYTCLLLLLPPPRPLLAQFFAATNPADFSTAQLQAMVRGLLFVGCAPPERWLKDLVQLVRSQVGQLEQKELLGFTEAFRFFGTQCGRAPWLRDVTALLEEFSCAV